MAKVSFNKLGLKVNSQVETVDFNGETIEVKQYLPIQQKLKMIGDILNAAYETENNYSNPVKVEVLTTLEIIFNYTNINFTEKQKEDSPKLYDLLYSSGLVNQITQKIPASEIAFVASGVKETSKAIYDYRHSLLGILDATREDYNNLNYDAAEIQKKLADPENMAFLKDVLTKLG